MSNHLHALISVEESYFDFVEASLYEEFRTASLLAKETMRKSFLHIRKIESFAQYREIYRYIYRNPLEVGIVPMAEMYEFSTLFELLGYGKKKFFPHDNMGLITNPFPILSWINWGTPSESSQAKADLN
jgi:hypothetical protein